MPANPMLSPPSLHAMELPPSGAVSALYQWMESAGRLQFRLVGAMRGPLPCHLLGLLVLWSCQHGSTSLPLARGMDVIIDQIHNSPPTTPLFSCQPAIQYKFEHQLRYIETEDGFYNWALDNQ